jgi:DNA topoisomerase-2
MSTKVIYQKLALRDQILLRPDTYIGNVKTSLTTDPVWINGIQNFEYRQARINDGLLRLVIEVISNAIDNVWRSTESKLTPRYIKINVTSEQVSVWNDGANISTEIHDTERIPIPEMIFGNLLTSSNYNDNEERKTSGRNGLGSKACNIFSKKFEIKIFNKEEKVMYTQTWEENMKNKSDPVIETKGFPSTIEDGKNGFTCVTFIPDFKRFGETEFTSEHLSMINKLVIDAAMTVHFNKVKVIYNDNVIPIEELSDYVNYYYPLVQKSEDEEENDSEEVKENEEIIITTKDCKIVLRPSHRGDFTQVSFVNGIHTSHGGIHVDAWCEAFFRPLISRINDKKDKSLHIDIRDIKKYFFIFVFSSLDKPSFDSQSKTRLTGPEVVTEVKNSHITKLLKWKFIEKIEDALKLKELASLKKNMERKKGKVNVEGLDDANEAGTKKSQECTICISEGLSAKSYIVKGMKEGLKAFGGKTGRDYIGVLPIRGKFINVKNASVQTLMNNKEVKSLIQALGLQFDVDYSIEENRKKLRYGRLLVSTDADHDGTHISALLFNFFQTLFSSLLKNNDFFYFMRVPIVKIDQGSKHAPLSFFYQDVANQYIEKNNVPKSKVKYYKGLGTANDNDVKQDFGRRIVQVICDKETNQLMEHIFHKDHTSFRKKWLCDYSPMEEYPNIKDYEIEPLNASTFLNQELIQFSIDDCKRSIPHLLDGFKESHRKVMYGAFKRNLRYSGPTLKVAQFAGYVAEHSGYHHGEDNLLDTIIKLAQRFVGSNNIPLLFNDGAFGSRLSIGKDAANGRYIYTKMDVLTRLIFKEEDDSYLEDHLDDGDVVEKIYYLPILPMVLINPTIAGIGTGWSCNIPAFNPKDLISWIKSWMEGDDKPVLKPWYRGFLGTIEMENGRVITKGIYKETKRDTYQITEIPIGKKMLSISRYKEELHSMMEKGLIKTIRDNSSEEKIDFIITVRAGASIDHKILGLIDTISLNNMVLFDSNNKIKKYNSVDEILDEYCSKRIDLYKIRREGELKKMKYEEQVLINRIRFVKCIIDDIIVLKNKDEDVLETELEELNFMRVDNKYDYLLSSQIRSMTSKRIEALENSLNDITNRIKILQQKTPQSIWIEELKALEKHL